MNNSDKGFLDKLVSRGEGAKNLKRYKSER
jgi:hypothetical protein